MIPPRSLTSASFAVLTLATLSACVPRAVPEPPQPRPAPRPQAVPAPVPTPVPPPTDWLQANIGEGRWTYRTGSTGSAALWGRGNEGARFAIACDRASRTVRFTRAGASAGSMELRSTNGVRTLTTVADAGNPGATATLPAMDDFLNQLVFTRGRFLVTATGADALIAPSWAEPFRVVEDCRG